MLQNKIRRYTQRCTQKKGSITNSDISFFRLLRLVSLLFYAVTPVLTIAKKPQFLQNDNIKYPLGFYPERVFNIIVSIIDFSSETLAVYFFIQRRTSNLQSNYINNTGIYMYSMLRERAPRINSIRVIIVNTMTKEDSYAERKREIQSTYRTKR